MRLKLSMSFSFEDLPSAIQVLVCNGMQWYAMVCNKVCYVCNKACYAKSATAVND